MNKHVINLAAAVICLAALTGCGAEKEAGGTAPNEILTLQRVPEDKMLITVRTCDGVASDSMELELEKIFPDIDIVIVKNSALEMSIMNDDIQDIVMGTAEEYMSFHKEKRFVDLSGQAFVQNYFLSSLQYGESEDSLYYLPGSSNIYGIVYNKDMFRSQGWEIPGSQEEFIELCRSIEESGIRALQPALYYADASTQLFEGFTYETVLAGVENAQWLKKYRMGEASLKGHMEPAFEIMQNLINENIIRDRDFETHPFDRSISMYLNQECAMIIETQFAPKYAEMIAGSDAPELGMMPFYSGGEGSDYLLSVPSYYMAANANLLKKKNHEKYAKVMDIFEYLSTHEGQLAASLEGGSMISSLKGSTWKTDAFTEAVESTVQRGQVVQQAFFAGHTVSEADNILHDGLRNLINGKIDVDTLCAEMDAAEDNTIEEINKEIGEIAGTSKQDFTVLQTAQLMALLFSETVDAQIGLCRTNTRNEGIDFKIYKGDITYNALYSIDRYLNTNFKLNLSSGESDTIIKYEMTGESIKKLLEPLPEEDNNVPYYYMTAAGLNIVFKPWAENGERVKSVTFPDGTPLKEDQIYTVAAWRGTIAEEYILKRAESSSKAASEILYDYLKKNPDGIKPEGSSTFRLEWD